MNMAMPSPAATSPPTTEAMADGLREARANPLGSMAHSHGRAATNWTAARMMPAARMLGWDVQANIGEPGLRVGGYAGFYAAARTAVRSGRRRWFRGERRERPATRE